MKTTAVETAIRFYESTRGGDHREFHSHAAGDKCTVDDQYVYLRDKEGFFLLAWYDYKHGSYHEA